ncbi:MAG TPA: response regulator transcription factor [Oculatellaceae cyanobacterium]
MTVKLLIADDHQIVRVGLRAVLSENPDFEVIGEASDGPSAIQNCLDKKPDVVLMDIRMPKLNGIEATKRIKSELTTIKILMLTSDERNDDVFAALSAGADGYCFKDIPLKQLTAAIQSVFSGGVWLDPRIARLLLHASARPVQQEVAKEPDYQLSEEELKLLRLLVEGLSTSEIADKLGTNTDIAMTAVKNLLDKLQVSNKTQAAVKAMKAGLV